MHKYSKVHCMYKAGIEVLYSRWRIMSRNKERELGKVLDAIYFKRGKKPTCCLWLCMHVLWLTSTANFENCLPMFKSGRQAAGSAHRSLQWSSVVENLLCMFKIFLRIAIEMKYEFLSKHFSIMHVTKKSTQVAIFCASEGPSDTLSFWQLR